MYLILGLIYMD